MIGYMDYIYFVYGFSLLLLAVMLGGRMRRWKGRLSWNWLVWAGLLLGTSIWLDMLAFSLGDSLVFRAVRTVMKMSSFLFLLEFGRTGLRAQGLWMPGWWIHPLLLSLAGLGGLAGIEGVNAASRYSLALPASMLAGWGMLREARQMDAARRRGFGTLGIALFITGLSATLFVPKASFFPASTLNREAFSAVVTLPIQFFHTFCFLAAALGIWLAYWRTPDMADDAGWFRRWLIPGAAAVLLAGGFVATNWCGQRAEEEIRDKLLFQVRNMAQMINATEAKALSFTSGDVNNPNFQRLSGQMTAYARETNLTRIYGMAVRGGAIVWGPISSAKNDLSPLSPGKVYKEPPAHLREVFQTNRARTAGPFKNEYGTLVSAFAPVFDPRTDEVLLVIGMDAEAGSWQASIARERLIPILFTLALMVILLAGSSALRWREELPAERRRRLRHAEAFLTAAIGLALTVAVAYQVHENEMRFRRARFRQMAEMRVDSVVQTLRDIHVHNLAGLAKFFESGEEITREQFRIYTGPLMDVPAVEVWSWIPFVSPQEKSRIEAEARRDGLLDFTIYQRDAQGHRTPAAGRDAYYPVFYRARLSGDEGALGYDLGSEPTRRAALEEAARTGLPTLTDPITLVTGSTTKKGALILYPVFVKAGRPDVAGNSSIRPARLHGFTVAALRFEPMLSRALAQFAQDRRSVNLDLYQLKPDGAPLWLTSSLAEEEKGLRREFPSRSPSDLSAAFALFALGKPYTVVAHPGPAFLAANPARAGCVAILVGLSLTAMISVFAGFLNNRRVALELQVLARTTELRESEQFNRQIIAGARDGIVVYDRQFNYLVWNPRMEAFRGIPASQVLGKNAFELFPHLREQKIDVLLERALAGESLEVSDRPYHNRQTGKSGYLSAAFSPLFDSSGKVNGVINIVRDITERKQAEEVLREAEERYRLLFDISTDALLIRDQEEIIRLANPTAIKMLKASRPDEIVGKSYLGFVHPEDRPESLDRGQRLIKAIQGEPGIDRACPKVPLREHRLLTLDGETVYVESTGVAFRHQGKAWIEGTFHDITQWKKAEEALRKSEEAAQSIAQENAVMAEIGQIISSTLNIEEVYERFAAEARRLIPFDRIAVSLNNPGEDTATVTYASGVEFGGKRIGDVFPLPHSGSQEVIRSRQGFLVQPEAVEELESRYSGLIPTFQAGLRSMILVPLISRNQVIGALHLRSKKIKAYTDRDLSLAERIGDQIAGAIANAHLFLGRKQAEEALRKSEEAALQFAQENSIIAEIGQIISSTLNIEEVYERFAETVRKLIPFDRIAINIINPEDMTFTIPYVLGVHVAEREAEKGVPLAGTGAQWVMQNRSSLFVSEENWKETIDRFPGLLPLFEAGFRSAMLIPLFSKDQVIAVLNLQTFGKNGYTEEDLMLAERVGTQIAGAIAGARLFAERKRAEEALRESEERWQFALEGSGDGVWDWNAQTNKVHFSRQWKVMFGFGEDDIGDTSNEWAKRVHPDDRERAFAEIGKYLGGKSASPFYISEHRVMCKDGTYKWILNRGKIVSRTQEGKPLRMIGTHTDITERRKSEEALRLHNEEVARERRNLELIFDSVQVGLVLVDGDGVVGRANDNFGKLVGHHAEEVLGRRPGEALSCANLYPTGQRCGDTPYCSTCPIRALLTRVLRGKNSIWGVEVNKELMRDGELRSVWLNVNGSSLEIDGRRNVLLSVIDITSRKNLELSLEKAKEAAEAADRAKSEFLANMSHEIRTPMNGVIGMTGLLLDTGLTPKQRQYAEVVRSSGESLLSLINDILDFSKIEARKLELDAMDFDLRTTLEDVTEMVAVRAQEKGLEMVCMIGPEVPSWLRGDPGRLRQIIVNLGGNAVKFTHRGGVTIQARLAAEDDRNATLRFSITDTGIGIPKDKQSILFSPFTQVDGSTTRKYGGTGLGLAISKQLAELMGGQIGVESEEGKGSTFWFTAVFAKQPAAQVHEPQPVADLKGLKALVVDDHAANRLLVTTLLTSWGCRFVEAADGKAALAMLVQAARDGDPFQVALLDNLMPGLFGPELGRMIKENPEIRDTRLIMMTSLAQRGDAMRLEEIGFSGYLTKPLRQSHLRECLALVMGQEGSPAAKAGAPLVTRHTVTESRKRRLRILLAEDNATNQMVSLEILGKLGYRADAVADGKEAINALQRLPYDLVLMDCEMPELDGFEATRIIRNWKLETGEAKIATAETTAAGEGAGEKGGAGLQVSSFKYRASSIPIIALTAYAMKGDRERCLEAGMSDYLSKPIQSGELARALDHWLAKKLDGEDGHGAFLDASAPSESSTAPRAPTRDTSGEAPAEEVIFDRDGFLKRVMGDESLARKLMNGFLADMPVQLEKMKAAIGAGDSPLAGQQAHQIKGAAANLGGMALQGVAFSMERAGKAGDLKTLEALEPQLVEQFEKLREFLKTAW